MRWSSSLVCGWSRGWDVELEAESGPVPFSEEFDPPEGGRSATFTVSVTAAGTCIIGASQLGSNRYAAAPAAGQMITVAPPVNGGGREREREWGNPPLN